ncbi:MAG: NfeD family protein [Eubacteriaceae bacterium]|jgi:membrane protein implicated in regulation of membrane protease activity
MNTLWIVLTIVFALAELLTPGALISIWFAIGAGAAWIGSYAGLSFAWQIALFIIVSVVFLFLTRPLADRLQKKLPEKLNADRYIGRTGTVETGIDNETGTGSVRISGKIWNARSDNGKTIAGGTQIKVIRLEGNKLVVLPTDDLRYTV